MDTKLFHTDDNEIAEAGEILRNGWAAKCTLQIRTARGRRARMKTQTVCFESFTRRAETSPVLFRPC